MKELGECPEDAAEHSRKGAYRGAIVDRRSQQRLEFVSDDPFVAFTLDDSVAWTTGKKPDGIVIADVDGIHWVCFIELKGRSDLDRAFEQLADGARHFFPSSRSGGHRTHGDDHHDAWAAGADDLNPLPAKEHRILGVFVTFRSLPQRPPQPPLMFAGKSFARRAVQVSKRKPNWAELSPRELLRKAGML